MTDLKMSGGSGKSSGFSVKDILDFPNVKPATSSNERNSPTMQPHQPVTG